MPTFLLAFTSNTFVIQLKAILNALFSSCFKTCYLYKSNNYYKIPVFNCAIGSIEAVMCQMGKSGLGPRVLDSNDYSAIY